MDPLTQGVLGASLPQSTAGSREATRAGVFGFLSGMAADLDVLIRSSTDPLLFLEYHRQFTHSLIFIPVGGAICALVLFGLFGRKRGVSLGSAWLYCTLGYATHAVLDACTTYGTMLFWPFSDVRIAWNTISIIDPLFTLPLLFGVAFAARRKNNFFVRVALAWALVYMALGVDQRNRAVDIGYDIAAGRGHTPVRLEAKPSFGNILVWKVVYETGDRFYVDAVRTGLSPKIFPGDSVQKLNVARDMPWLDSGSQQAIDVERFRWFSNGYVAKDPHHENRIIDIRYSMVPNQVNALWSLELSRSAGAGEHAAYLVHRDAGPDSTEALWAMLWDS
jgi:inner membrane protein